ncbi:MAG: DNRLRE domain-containing protein [Candidatus Aegiribacteria sp.]|nr:DNRLRE domain-containing protein [Candidatus Aegiribacteria sp.]
MLKYFIVTIVLLLAVSCVPQARTVTVYPSNDSFAWEWAPSNNYGSWSHSRIGKRGLNLQLDPNRGKHVWTALMFDLTPYSGITIDSAIVAVYIYETVGTFPPNEVWIAKCSDDWEENDLTWNNRPGYHNWLVPPAPQYAWWTIDVTTWAQAWIDEAYPNYGLWIGTNATSVSDFWIYTKEEPGTEVDPQLILYYTGINLESSSDEN